jgi:hypothetical protein
MKSKITGSQSHKFMEPQNEIERSIQGNIHARLDDISKFIYGNVNVDEDLESDLRTELRSAIVDRALRNSEFQKAFLSMDKDKRKIVKKSLKDNIEQAVTSVSAQTDVNTEAMARGIVDNLANEIAPKQQIGANKNKVRDSIIQ